MNIDDLRLHDALLESFQLGPRRELILKVFMPEVTSMTITRRKLRGRRIAIRFGDIQNYPNVQRFLL
jgi:hypothetical protein